MTKQSYLFLQSIHTMLNDYEQATADIKPMIIERVKTMIETELSAFEADVQGTKKFNENYTTSERAKMRERQKAACLNVLRAAKGRAKWLETGVSTGSQEEKECKSMHYCEEPHWVNNMQVFADGCRVIIPHTSIIMNTTNADWNAFPYKRVLNFLNVAPVVSIDVPSIEELRELVGGKYNLYCKKTVKVGAEGILLNAMYLLTLLEGVPGAKVYRCGDSRSPLMFINEKGDKGLLMPMAPRED